MGVPRRRLPSRLQLEDASIHHLKEIRVLPAALRTPPITEHLPLSALGALLRPSVVTRDLFGISSCTLN